jgi:hypothetical protein
MRLPGYVIAFALGILLATTTPIGTGTGVHQFDLLHPLFSHVHLINGRVVTHQQLENAALTQPIRPGVNLGADDGASAAEGGLGVSPTLPAGALFSAVFASSMAAIDDYVVPSGRTEAPPDPPPL